MMLSICHFQDQFLSILLSLQTLLNHLVQTFFFFRYAHFRQNPIRTYTQFYLYYINRMLSARHKIDPHNGYSTPLKLKINKNRLPLDFFQQSRSVEVRRSQEVKLNGVNRDSATPIFERHRPSPIKINRKVVTALDKYENQEDQLLIRDVIFSSRNIRKLRKLSQCLKGSGEKEQKQWNVYTPQLPPIKQRRMCAL